MSILLLSLLLLLLVGIGALMGRRIVAMEQFQDKPKMKEKFADAPAPQAFQVTGTVNVDPLARDMAVQAAVVEGGKKHNNVVPNSPYHTPEGPSISPPGPIVIPSIIGPGGQYNPPGPAPNPTPYPPSPAPNPTPYNPTPAPNPTPYPPSPAPNPTPNGGWCPACPDMSQYIRMDEIPCWNCTLP